MANGSYNDLIRTKKTRPREIGIRKITRDKLLTSLLLSLKAPAYPLRIFAYRTA